MVRRGGKKIYRREKNPGARNDRRRPRSLTKCARQRGPVRKKRGKYEKCKEENVEKKGRAKEVTGKKRE